MYYYAKIVKKSSKEKTEHSTNNDRVAQDVKDLKQRKTYSRSPSCINANKYVYKWVKQTYPSIWWYVAVSEFAFSFSASHFIALVHPKPAHCMKSGNSLTGTSRANAFTRRLRSSVSNTTSRNNFLGSPRQTKDNTIQTTSMLPNIFLQRTLYNRKIIKKHAEFCKTIFYKSKLQKTLNYSPQLVYQRLRVQKSSSLQPIEAFRSTGTHQCRSTFPKHK